MCGRGAEAGIRGPGEANRAGPGTGRGFFAPPGPGPGICGALCVSENEAASRACGRWVRVLRARGPFAAAAPSWSRSEEAPLTFLRTRRTGGRRWGGRRSFPPLHQAALTRSRKCGFCRSRRLRPESQRLGRRGGRIPTARELGTSLGKYFESHERDGRWDRESCYRAGGRCGLAEMEGTFVLGTVKLSWSILFSCLRISGAAAPPALTPGLLWNPEIASARHTMLV
ncbi:uncharacterized protein [Symphalangus syndactylus]|uniref:uncharacterized protein n=1 Tax=Symphalangus syndactylus TaxID=9590 RepID=UPI0024423C5E|nr:uncharacterized protein LOC129460274 [Symphalangus syndactylus]